MSLPFQRFNFYYLLFITFALHDHLLTAVPKEQNVRHFNYLAECGKRLFQDGFLNERKS